MYNFPKNVQLPSAWKTIKNGKITHAPVCQNTPCVTDLPCNTNNDFPKNDQLHSAWKTIKNGKITHAPGNCLSPTLFMAPIIQSFCPALATLDSAGQKDWMAKGHKSQKTVL